jgi:hypothetical protein
MSRKTIFSVLAVLGAAAAVVSTEFGLSVNLGAVVAGIAGIVVYILGEAKADIAKLGQSGKWTDPKFWITMVTAIVTALAQEVALPISPEIIIAVLTAIVGLLFKKEIAARRATS